MRRSNNVASGMLEGVFERSDPLKGAVSQFGFIGKVFILLRQTARGSCDRALGHLLFGGTDHEGSSDTLHWATTEHLASGKQNKCLASMSFCRDSLRWRNDDSFCYLMWSRGTLTEKKQEKKHQWL